MIGRISRRFIPSSERKGGPKRLLRFKEWMKILKMSKLGRFCHFSVEYFCEICNTGSMHGINHFVAPNRHYFETIFWMLVVILSGAGFFSITSNIFERYRVSPTVISLERDHLSWNTTFPAATICWKQINETALQAVVDEYNVTDEEELKSFLKTLVFTSVADMTDLDITDHPAIKPENFLEIIDRVQMEFEPQILTSLNSKVYMQKSMSEMGLCYSINSKVSAYISLEYWNNNVLDIRDFVDEVHQLDGEVFIQLSDFYDGYSIYFHSSTEIPQMLDRSLVGENMTFRSVVLRVVNLYSTDEVRNLRLEQRKCRFMEENILKRSPIYSYSMCNVECRANKTLEICGCMPHYYRTLQNERICKLSELRCLYTYRSTLSTVSRDEKCHCLPTCETNYFSVYEDVGVQWDQSTQIRYAIREYPKTRLKREILYGVTEVLVNCGGAAGLLLGCSVLTIIEFVYFATLRIFWFFIGYRHDTK